jgi:pilus assembly protein CpaC
MNSRLLKSVLTAACALSPLAVVPAGPARAQSVTSPAQDLVLSVGRGQLVTVPGTMTDVFVANDAIADVQVKSQRQLYVFAKAGGVTTIYASNASGEIVWSANVRVGSNIDSVDQMLALAMPDAKITASTMGTSTVLLTGTVAAPEDAAEAERLVAAFVGQGANVVSRLRMATPLQVNLRVRFAEVSRSLVRNLGVSLTTVDSTSGFKFGIGEGRTGGIPTLTPNGPLGVGRTSGPSGGSVLTSLASGSTLGAFGRFLGLDIGSALDLAERDGLVTTLSEPNLTAL